MTIDEMKEIKQERGYSYEQIAELSGVPLSTVQKIFCGETRSPRYATLHALERVFQDEKAPSMVKEEVAYDFSGSQQEYTVKDYYALPDERRVELIDGVFYDMSAPSFVHQGIAGEVYFQIASFIKANKGECVVRMSPIDVRLDCDNRTMVQPDVLILCDRSKIMRWGIMGAPDFVLEVLSPSTKRKDCMKKLAKYMEAGVREYWMIDPDKCKLIVYQFDTELYPAVYGLTGKVPVGIYEGRLLIDLDQVAEAIEEYPDDGDEE